MKVKIDRRLKTPLYKQIADDIKKKIISEELPENYGLLSERRLAEVLGVHRNTVTRAYNELEADGLVTSRQGKGYRVSAVEKTENRIKRVNWENMIKSYYLDRGTIFDELFYKTYTGESISFAGGMAATDVYHKNEITQRFHEIINRDADTEYYYTSYQGEDELLDLLVKNLREKGIFASKGQIQLLSEVNQAIDFLISIFVKPGDYVILEEPVSPDIYRAVDFAGAKAITVPMDEDGMICKGLGHLIELYEPRFIYVSSSYQDPTTRTMPLERRKELLEISYRYRIPVIEEDGASDLYYGEGSIPALKALDKGDNVIYINSFALSFIPGMSVTFVAAPKSVVDTLSYLVSVRLISLDWLPQRLLYKYMEDGTYWDKLGEFREEYRRKRDIMCSWLDKIDLIKYEKPEGGVYIWCRLPEYMEADRLLSMCRKHGVSFMPGELFFPGGNGGSNCIRLNFSYPQPEQIDRGMKILADCIYEYENSILKD